MGKLQGVLCDLDGTLVNSEPFHLLAWNDLLRREGYRPDADWSRECIGIPDSETLKKLVGLFPRMKGFDNLLETKQEHYRELIGAKGRALAYPGVETQLERLAEKGFRLAVGSNSGTKNTDAALEAAGLIRFFDVRITFDMVKRGKPDPDIYRLAAEHLGLPPRTCAVVEDSPAGVLAGKAAGCMVLGVGNSWAEDKLVGVDEFFVDTPSALRWIENSQR